MMSGSTARSGLFPFTASQLQELEHQALIYKYMASGVPIPPHLLYTIKRTCFDISTNLILHQPQHIGWNCFQLGYGKKVDPEPGRCKRTDGKKWRCSKEAYADSKYCERHMHRGRNRSRKPVEVITNNNISTRINSTSRPPGIGLSSQDYTNFLLGSFAYSRNSYGHGMEEAVSEASVTRRSASGSSSSVDSWQLAPLTMGSPLGHLKQRTNYSVSQIGQATNYLQLQSLNNESSKQQQIHNQYHYNMEMDTEDQQQPKNVMHHFFDELPPEDNKDSWLDLEPKTQLSISVPNS